MKPTDINTCVMEVSYTKICFKCVNQFKIKHVYEYTFTFLSRSNNVTNFKIK
jgi:hypothetical protein